MAHFGRSIHEEYQKLPVKLETTCLMGLYRQPDHTEAGQHSGKLSLHPFYVTLPDGMAGGRTKDDYTECTGNGQQQFLVGKGIYTGLRSRFRILRQPL